MKNNIKGSIDRFEGNYAVLIIGEEGDRLDIQRSFLPEEAKEGDFIKIRIEISPDKTREAKEKSADLIEKLKRRLPDK